MIENEKSKTESVPPTHCSECGGALEPRGKRRGRQRLTCSRACRDKSHRRQRAEREGRETQSAEERSATAAERREHVLRRYRELVAEGATRPVTTIRLELDLSRQRVHQILQSAGLGAGAETLSAAEGGEENSE
jgi:hypothetical protein